MWLHSQVSLDAGYLSYLKNPTDAYSIVCDAKEDVLAGAHDNALLVLAI